LRARWSGETVIVDEPIEQLSLFGPPEWSEVPPPAWLDVRLERLERLLELHRAHDGHLNVGGQRLLQRSIFATYVECREMGGSEPAGALLGRYREVESDGDGDASAMVAETGLPQAAGE
jgi:hypothetical protein